MSTSSRDNKDMESSGCKERFSPLLSVAEGRLKRDYAEMTNNPCPNPHIQTFLSPPTLEHFTFCLPVSLAPLIGPFRTQVFHCVVCIPAGYPFHPPWVQARNSVAHPNVDISTGLVDLNIVRPETWHKAVTLHNVLFALQQVLISPEIPLYAPIPPSPVPSVSLKRRPQPEKSAAAKRPKLYVPRETKWPAAFLS